MILMTGVFSIWDYRYNHIPLPRGTSTLGFDPRTQPEEMATFNGAVATRKAGWGVLNTQPAPGRVGGTSGGPV